MRDLLAATHLRLGRGGPLLGLLRRLSRLQQRTRMVCFDCRSTYGLEARLLRPAPPVLTPPSPVAPVQAPGGSR